jgi:hypothetical protein
MDNIERLKIVLREKDCPFFDDEELAFYFEENGGDFNKTAYQCLIIKSESTSLVLSGLEAADSSKYFRRLAQRYRGNNSGVLRGN